MFSFRNRMRKGKILKESIMVKQDQNRSSWVEQATKQVQAPFQDLQKEKNSEDRKDLAKYRFTQRSNYQCNKKGDPFQNYLKLDNFDRDEGEGRSQKS